MELKWVEDFFATGRNGQFSRPQNSGTSTCLLAANRALEQWLGAELIDRTSYPTKLTRPVNNSVTAAAEIVRQAIDARAIARGPANAPTDTILFAAPHARCR